MKYCKNNGTNIETRRLVLNGTDGVVFVADSTWDRMEDNLKSFNNLGDNLRSHNLALDSMPYILQFNKRDVPDVAPAVYMDFVLNRAAYRVPSLESVATHGDGVFRSLNAIAKLVVTSFITKHRLSVAHTVRPSNKAACEEGVPA